MHVAFFTIRECSAKQKTTQTMKLRPERAAQAAAQFDVNENKARKGHRSDRILGRVAECRELNGELADGGLPYIELLDS
jgi:hypothetical protein